MAGTAAFKLQQAAQAFRSTSGEAGGKASSTNRQGKGVPWTFSTKRVAKGGPSVFGTKRVAKGVPSAFSTGRQGKTAPQIRVGGIRSLRPYKGRVYSIRGFVPQGGGSTDLSRFASARVYKKLGIRVARGAYFLVSPTGERALAAPGKYTLEDGSVLVV